MRDQHSTTQSRSWTRVGLLFPALPPIALVAWYVAGRANLVPIGDQWWDVTYVAVKYKARILTLKDLFVYYEGHRNAVIRALTVVFTALTDYDVRIMRFASFGIALLNLGIAAWLLAKTERRVLPLGATLFALIIFTLHDPNSWLDYYFAVWFLVPFFFLLALLILEQMRAGLTAFGLTIASAILATFSLGSGMAAWFALPVAFLAKSAYRRWYYLLLWVGSFGLCMAFYTSNYWLSPHEAGPSFSLGTLWREGIPLTAAYLVQFQATRFDAGNTSIAGGVLALVSLICMGANAFYLARHKQVAKNLGLWVSLVLFALGGSALTIVGRGIKFPPALRYSPGADVFWIAFVALALLTLARRPPPFFAVINVLTAAALVILTVEKDVWTLHYGHDPCPRRCDECVTNYPLRRGNCFRACFGWSEEQSCYLFAAFRLSVFADEPPRLILPQADAPVVADMPNRWLSVYVRDYMLAGVPPDRVTFIAPERGEWALPVQPYSPYYRGEWPTDILSNRLQNVAADEEAFAAAIPQRIGRHPRAWYLNTPETGKHFERIAAAFAQIGFRGTPAVIADPRYAKARFSLWCFSRQPATCPVPP